MPKTIAQKVVFKNAAPKVLYNFYMDSKQHAAVTGAPAKITTKVGAQYKVWGDYISGKNLHLVKDKLIVQSWRGSDWRAEDPDSLFMISLEANGKDTVLTMIHSNVPDEQYDGLVEGWKDFYWKPWKKALKKK